MARPSKFSPEKKLQIVLSVLRGEVKVGVIAIDGTKVRANASNHANRDYEQIAKEILAEPLRSTRPRMSSMGTSVAMSCRAAHDRAWSSGVVSRG